jgi:NAD(P)-dependent dehydrogenase (short-subunit alcohol dehydrogenase family)
MVQSLRGFVVVITGASSGIGRATALAFASKGACIVLAARREKALREVVSECERRGGSAVAVPTDVCDEAAVHELARRALEQYGRIDVWINNAGVALFARFEDSPSDLYRRVLDTNLMGTVHGARAALPRFLEQGSGVLINVASISAFAGQPFGSAYGVSKAAIRAFGQSLREELTGSEHIHVCTILPSMTDTPIWQNAANYSGHAIHPPRPVSKPEDVAEVIVRLARKPKSEVVVGGAGRFVRLCAAVAPGLMERVSGYLVKKTLFKDEPAPPSSGNLLAPSPVPASVSGGWKLRGTPRLRAAITRAASAVAPRSFKHAS